MPRASNIREVLVAPERLVGLEQRVATADIRAHRQGGYMPFFINESILHRPVHQILPALVG